MEVKGHAVIYFHEVTVEPPLSPVHIFPLQDVLPSHPDQTVSEKTVCYAKMGEKAYPCLILCVDYVSTMEVLWDEIFRRRKAHYEDTGKRWSMELKLVPELKPLRTDDADVSLPGSCGSASSSNSAPDVRKSLIISRSGTRVSRLSKGTASGSLGEELNKRPVHEPSPELGSPVSMTRKPIVDKPRSAASTVGGKCASARPRSRSPSAGKRHSFPSIADSRLAKAVPKSILKKSQSGRSLSHRKRHHSPGESSDESRSPSPYSSDSEQNSDIEEYELDEHSVERSLSNENIGKASSSSSTRESKPATSTCRILPHTVQMVGKHSKIQNCKIPENIFSVSINKWVDTGPFLDRMIEEAGKYKTWRSATRYAAQNIFTRTELSTSVCTVPRRDSKRAKLLLDQEKVNVISGLTGICCKEMKLKTPTISEVKRAIMRHKKNFLSKVRHSKKD